MGQKIVRVWTFLVCALAVVAMVVESRPSPLFSITDGDEAVSTMTGRKLFKLVSNTVMLPYHNGPLLSGNAGAPLNVYITWYGSFTPTQKAVITDFFASLNQQSGGPSVASWWKLTSAYKDDKNNIPAEVVALAGQTEDINYSMGKSLKRTDIETLVVKSRESTTSANSVYFLLTAEDVEVEGFCMNTCAAHFYTSVESNLTLPYSWVGNPGIQCPGRCAWPYAIPEYGSPQGATPLVSPNADPGMDGMVINIASMLAGIVTNPFNNGYYQGDAAAPLEAATACSGIYGVGAYPGNPGQLIRDPITQSSYNAQGVGTRKYLLPALWDPATMTCTPVP